MIASGKSRFMMGKCLMDNSTSRKPGFPRMSAALPEDPLKIVVGSTTDVTPEIRPSGSNFSKGSFYAV